MNPFDTPPSGEPLSSEPPVTTERSGPGRGRMALVAVLTAGLIGGGVAAVGQFASADEPQLSAVAAPDDPSDETVPPADDESETPESERDDEVRDVEVVIDDGEGEPVVIELGDIEGDLERLSECVGLPVFGAGELDLGEWELGELPNIEEFLEELPFDLEALENLEGRFGESGEFDEFGEFQHDGSVTVAGPDGVSVIDLGENGSVTVTTNEGEISVEAAGDATVTELEDVFAEFEGMFDEMFADGELERMFDEMFADGELERMLDELLQSFPAVEGEFEPLDPAAVQACLDEVLAN